MDIKARKSLHTGSPTSRLQFESDSGLRYLLLDGKRAYNLGIGCQTCQFLFERLPGANQEVQIEATAEALRQGVQSLDDEVVATIGHGMPEGDYELLLSETTIRQVRPGDSDDYFATEQISLWGEDNFWCLPHDPRVPYFRAGDYDLGNGKRLFNFVVPMFPTKWLTLTTVSEYVEALRTKGSGTAVAIAVLDVKFPVDWPGDETPDPAEHWCLTHYLVDGHHKLHAASESRKTLRLLSFLATSQGISEREEIEEVIHSLSSVG